MPASSLCQRMMRFWSPLSAPVGRMPGVTSSMLGQSLLGAVQQGFGVILGLHRGLALLVFLGVGLGVLDHLLDVGLGQAARRLDADLLLLAGALVLGMKSATAGWASKGTWPNTS